jgi:hypothetical protein
MTISKNTNFRYIVLKQDFRLGKGGIFWDGVIYN